MKELVLATKNPGKIEWFSHFLARYQDRVNLLDLADFSISTEVIEPFDTAEENARHKARAYCDMVGRPVLASDISLHVDFLSENDQPGVRIRRIRDGVTRMSDQEVYDYWR